MEVAICSDTHIPSRASRIPDPFVERIRGADHVIHAGDVTSEDTLARLREWADDLTAVRGNMDPGLGLRSVETTTVGGVTFVVTHGTGTPEGWTDRVAEATRHHGDPDAVGVAGHTHRVEDVVHDGVRLLNPGSATGAAPAQRTTMLTAEAANGDLDVTVHEP